MRFPYTFDLMKKRNFIYKLLLFSVLGLGLLGLTRLYFHLTDDFRLSNITYEMPYHQKWEVPDLTPEENQHIQEILNQKFFYVGKGAQSYAFRSADDKYIIKFFKFKHLKPSFLVDLLPAIGALKQYKEKQVLRKNKLLNSVFDGYRLAYDVHAPEAGLIYIHLNKSHNFKKTVQVEDKLGFIRSIDLDEVPFILQEKAKTTRAVMSELLNDNNLSLAEHRIKQIFDLYLLEYSKGIYDRDHGVMHNTGFVGNKPIHLDVGKLTKDERMKEEEYYKPDLILIFNKFDNWFKTNYPQHHPTLHAYMTDQMQSYFGHEL